MSRRPKNGRVAVPDCEVALTVPDERRHIGACASFGRDFKKATWIDVLDEAGEDSILNNAQLRRLGEFDPAYLF